VVPTATPNVNTGAWDDTTVITVNLYSGTLSSATDLEVMNGANAALIGSEVIQWAEATQVDADTWELSRLLRGRKGTEEQIAGHGSDELFTLLSGAAVFRENLSDSERGRTYQFKAVGYGQTLADVVAVPLVIEGNSLKPYNPTGESSSVAGGDITLYWVRRTRIGGELQDYIDVPLNEETESYEIDILADDLTTVKRTLTSATTQVTYTAAQQTTDFGGPISHVFARIYQMSARVGRGRSRLNFWYSGSPPAPTSPSAIAGTGQITVGFTGSPSAQTFNIKRSLSPGGPYTTVKTGVPYSGGAQTYIDTGLSTGVTYYYVISASNGYFPEGANSSEVSATPS
jgi:hypothetical protein